ncbi:hypothetical protein OEZ86_004972 [Tetradesmus obliquus]|nr:hypothetical protein OEZ86_004972 [Tetradesmus obliquus]
MPELKEAAAAQEIDAVPDDVAAAAAAAAGEKGSGGCRLLCDASGEHVEGLGQVAGGHLLHRNCWQLVRLAAPVHCAAKDGTVLMEAVHGGLELFQCNTLLRPGCLAAACISSSSKATQGDVQQRSDDDDAGGAADPAAAAGGASCQDEEGVAAVAAANAADGSGDMDNAAPAAAAAAAAAGNAAGGSLEGAAGSSSSRVWLFCADPLCLLSRPSTTLEVELPEWRWSLACSSGITLSSDEVGELQGMGIQLTGPPPAAAAGGDGDGCEEVEGDAGSNEVCKELFKEEEEDS